MSDTLNSGSDSGILGFVSGKGFFQQLLLVLVLLTLLFFLFVTVEYLTVSFLKLGSKAVQLMPYTVSAEDKQYVLRQDLNKFPDGKLIPLSDNERTGVEFSYSFYLYVNPSTFTGDDTLKHVFHKGFVTPWPLMGPGVFVKGDSNTLRVVMNTHQNPMTYVDVENIPVRKWFHCVLVCKKNSLEVYLNGNLIKKLPFEGTLPYQNFQDLIMFSPLKYTLSKTQVASLANVGLGGQLLRFEGAFSGSLSNLTYFAYAISYTEIQALTTAGVSTRTLTKSQDMPPYLTDTYWTSTYQQQN